MRMQVGIFAWYVRAACVYVQSSARTVNNQKNYNVKALRYTMYNSNILMMIYHDYYPIMY